MIFGSSGRRARVAAAAGRKRPAQRDVADRDHDAREHHRGRVVLVVLERLDAQRRGLAHGPGCAASPIVSATLVRGRSPRVSPRQTVPTKVKNAAASAARAAPLAWRRSQASCSSVSATAATEAVDPTQGRRLRRGGSGSIWLRPATRETRSPAASTRSSSGAASRMPASIRRARRELAQGAEGHRRESRPVAWSHGGFGMFGDPDFQKRLQEMAEQMQASRRSPGPTTRSSSRST